LRSQIAFLGADVQVIICNQISEHSVDEMENIKSDVGMHLLGGVVKQLWASKTSARAKYKIRPYQGRQEN
jgi:hypothetical protein